MIGPLLKAQAVAFLTKKLLESKTFVKGVEAAHGTFAELQEGAYQSLLKATQEGDKALPTQSTTSSTSSEEKDNLPEEMKFEKPIKDQNEALLKFIERTRRDLAKKAKE